MAGSSDEPKDYDEMSEGWTHEDGPLDTVRLVVNYAVGSNEITHPTDPTKVAWLVYLRLHVLNGERIAADGRTWPDEDEVYRLVIEPDYARTIGEALIVAARDTSLRKL